MQKLCVFCGSRQGRLPAFPAAALELAQQLIKHNIELVYGAGSVGLMGIMAKEMLGSGGRVTGIIPQHLCKKEVLQEGLTHLHITESLLDRKLLMMEQADAFVALPGGLGTFDEILEVMTWRQLGQHTKPVALLNVAGYFDPFLAVMEQAITEGFLDRSICQSLIIENEVKSLMDVLFSVHAPTDKN